MTDYAYYQGDALLAVGNVAELAKQFGVQKKTIWFYATAAHQRRMDKAKHPSHLHSCH